MQPLPKCNDLLGLQAGTGGGQGTPEHLESKKCLMRRMRFCSCFLVFFMSEEGHHICNFARCLLRSCQCLRRGTLLLLDKLGTRDLKLLFGKQVGSLCRGWPSYKV